MSWLSEAWTNTVTKAGSYIDNHTGYHWKKAETYYQQHLGNYIQKSWNHWGHEISCDPAVGSAILGLEATGGAIGSIWSAGIAGAAAAAAMTATKISLKAGYKECNKIQRGRAHTQAVKAKQSYEQKAIAKAKSVEKTVIKDTKKHWILILVIAGGVGLIIILKVGKK